MKKYRVVKCTTYDNKGYLTDTYYKIEKRVALLFWKSLGREELDLSGTRIVPFKFKTLKDAVETAKRLKRSKTLSGTHEEIKMYI